MSGVLINGSLPLFEQRELTIDDDVSPKVAANLVMHFSFNDEQGNSQEDAVQGV